MKLTQLPPQRMKVTSGGTDGGPFLDNTRWAVHSLPSPRGIIFKAGILVNKRFVPAPVKIATRIMQEWRR